MRFRFGRPPCRGMVPRVPVEGQGVGAMLLEVSHSSTIVPGADYRFAPERSIDTGRAARRAAPAEAPVEPPRPLPVPAGPPAGGAGGVESTLSVADRTAGRIVRSRLADLALPGGAPSDPLAEFRSAVASDGVPESFPKEREAVYLADLVVAAEETEEEAKAEDATAGAVKPGAEEDARVAGPARPEETLPGQPLAEESRAEGARAEEARREQAPARPAGTEDQARPAEGRGRAAEELVESVAILNGDQPQGAIDILR